jgi:dTDP-4-amino-4,6-dideoxygalactose transaminase
VKGALEDIAFFGGKPLFGAPLHVGRPNEINSDVLLDHIRGVLARQWLTNDGPMVRHLEMRLADFLDVSHCVLVANATMGIQLVARAMKLKGAVLLPAFTFVGTCSALAWIGLRPVLCDVEPRTHNLSPADALRKAGPDTGGILGVHLWGRPCNIAGLERVARKLDVPLFFDSAHAIGCSYHGEPLARFGRASVFSLHATKCVNALEGGVIATNDLELSAQVRLLRNFGFADEDQVDVVGVNAKMNEFSAAMGLTSLDGYEKVKEHNRQIHGAYVQSLADLSKVKLVSADGGEAWNYHYAILELDEQDGAWRDALFEILTAENVFVRRYFRPGLHRLGAYAQAGSVPTGGLRVTEKLAETLLALPTGTQMTTQDAATIGALITFCFRHRGEIERCLASAGQPAKQLAAVRLGEPVTHAVQMVGNGAAKIQTP